MAKGLLLAFERFLPLSLQILIQNQEDIAFLDSRFFAHKLGEKAIQFVRSNESRFIVHPRRLAKSLPTPN